MTKGELRARMGRVLASLDPVDLDRRSLQAALRFQATQAWQDAAVVLCFLSMPGELNSSFLIESAHSSGRRVAVPRIEGDVIRFLFLPYDAGELPRDKWGIPVPCSWWEPLQLRGRAGVLVAAPGLAFDRQGNRLGRGKGYYDMFLAEARGVLGNELVALGICLSDQLVESVPCTERDQRLNGVVTDQETILVS